MTSRSKLRDENSPAATLLLAPGFQTSVKALATLCALLVQK